MSQIATVIGCFNDGRAEIEFSENTSCGSSCASCHGCDNNEKTIRIIAENEANAEKGDRVVFESCDGKILKAAFLLYFLPIVFMVLFYFIFPFKEIYRITASLAGFFISLLFCFVHYGKRKKRTVYKIKEILR